ncbi:hypothetical protein LTR62_001004 [Meristemomyces frigidus]|uniref:Uncharacterized protein n=1 Tax=Meristemomyces frigidus TaxID=1508187 RepID=A0AAN7T8E6_9PEZI|nr:hypothetical protein LTR62_001004 [Meristemomyces frigidus]
MAAVAVESRRPGVKGQKIAGRPGRFDPSEPLHMTTRRKAKNPAADATPSINGSIDEGSSRRNSFDDPRPTTSHSHTSQFTPSTNHSKGTARVRVTPSPLSRDPDTSLQDFADGLESPSPSPAQPDSSTNPRKRKRDNLSPSSSSACKSVTPPIAQFAGNNVDGHSAHGPDVREMEVQRSAEAEAPGTASGSDDNAEDEIAVNIGLIDGIPASSQVSHLSSGLNTPEIPATQLLEDDFTLNIPGPHNELMLHVPEAGEPDEVSDAMPLVRGVRGGRKQGGKRRRAVHAIQEVEMALRRQQALKTTFRNLARAQKSLLLELSQRELDNLITNAKRHTEVAEYEEIKTGLSATLEARKEAIQTQHNLELELLKSKLANEEKVRRKSSFLRVKDAQDVTVTRLKHDFLNVARAAQLVDHEQREHTYDEDDDVVQQAKYMGYRFKRGSALDPVYDSRSRPAQDIDLAIGDLERRLAMRRMLAQMPSGDLPDADISFAIKDNATTNATAARKDGIEGTDFLAAAANEAERQASVAAKEMERLASIVPIRNEEAIGLQVLGDLCNRPLVRAPIPTPTTNMQSVSALLQQGSAIRPASPPINPPISVEMSPRAKQIIKERNEGTMPPPRTPRQPEATFGSPFGSRVEQPAASPVRQAGSPNGLLLAAPRPLSREDAGRVSQSPNHDPMDPRSYHESSSPELSRRRQLLPSQNGAPPGFEHFHPMIGVPDRRSRSLDDPAAFGHMAHSSLPFSERIAPRPLVFDHFPRPEEHPDHVMIRAPAENRLSGYDRSASDCRPQEHRGGPNGMPAEFRFPPDQIVNGPTRSRQRSVSIKDELPHDFDDQREQKIRSMTEEEKDTIKPTFHKKSNKMERRGFSRREMANRNRSIKNAKPKTTPASVPGASGPLTLTTGLYTPAPPDPAPRPWDVPRQHRASFSNPSLPSHNMPPPGPPRFSGPPPSGPPSKHSGPDLALYHHNSFSIPRGNERAWPTIAPSPLHTVAPHHQPPAPPPGIDRYRSDRPFPPPPPSFPPNPYPYPPQPHSAPGGYGPQPIPPLAPATTSSGHLGGWRSAESNYTRPPAFAQQLEHQGKGRTNSGDSVKKGGWRSYEGPPPGKR